MLVLETVGSFRLGGITVTVSRMAVERGYFDRSGLCPKTRPLGSVRLYGSNTVESAGLLSRRDEELLALNKPHPHHISIIRWIDEWAANCKCGWKGERHMTKMAARREFEAHKTETKK